MPSEENDYKVNWSEGFDYMHSIKDPVVKNLMTLVYEKLMLNDLKGARPAAPFDLLYCFKNLHDAFSQSGELYLALQAGDVTPDAPGRADSAL
jgi:hypothetical protein